MPDLTNDFLRVVIGGNVCEGDADEDLEIALERGNERYASAIAEVKKIKEPHLLCILSGEGQLHMYENMQGFGNYDGMRTLLMLAAYALTDMMGEAEGLDVVAAFLAKLLANCL